MTEQILNMGIDAVVTKKIPMNDLVDRSFTPTDIKPADIDLKTAGGGD